MAQLSFDERTARSLDRAYQRRDMVLRRQLVRAALGAAAGDRILDVGCGPGYFVAEILGEVGPDGAVVAVDASPDMLALARHRCEGRANVTFKDGDASALPVDDAGFDRALCVQVMEYVAEPAAALAELHRALVPGGRAVIWDTDWSTAWWHTLDPDRMRRFLSAWDGHLADPALPRTLAARMRAAGFEAVRLTGHSFATADYDPDAFGVALIPMVADYVRQCGGDVAAEVDAWTAEQRDLGERGEFFFAGTQFCVTGTKPLG